MKKIVLIAGLVVFITQIQAQRINVPQGLTFEISNAANMDMELMEQKMAMVTNSFVGTSIKEASDTGFLFTNTIKRMTIQGNAMGQNINFDSDKKEDMEGPVGSKMKNIIGSSQEIGVDKQGKVTKVSESADATEFADAMNLAGQITVGMPYYLLIPQSKQDVKVGESWIDSTAVSAESMHTVSNYTLKGVTPTDITIAFNTTMKLNRPIEQQGITMQMNLQGNIKGESIYDKTTGLLKTSNSLCDMNGKMEVMGQQMPIAIKGTTILTVKK